MRNDFKIRPRPAFKGGGIAKRGFGRAMYEDGGDVEKNTKDVNSKYDNDPEDITYGKKNYGKNNLNRQRKEETRKHIQKKSFDKNVDIYEDEEINDSPVKRMIKYGYRKIKDPIDDLTRSVYENDGDKSARKTILGYKKGGKIKKRRK